MRYACAVDVSYGSKAVVGMMLMTQVKAHCTVPCYACSVVTKFQFIHCWFTICYTLFCNSHENGGVMSNVVVFPSVANMWFIVII